MRKNRRWSTEEKLKIVLKHLNEGYSMKHLAREYACSDGLINRWVARYKQEGMEGLNQKRTKKHYSDDAKQKMINEVLSGSSQSEVMRKYRLSSSSLLSSWIKAYTSGEKPTSKGRWDMAKGRKTTLEERLDIVDFALVNDKDYQKTAEKYNVSYQQVYSWVRKYERDGKEGLVDRRGRKPPSSEGMSETERLEAELKESIRQNRRLQMENDYLKKLNEIEQKLRDSH